MRSSPVALFLALVALSSQGASLCDRDSANTIAINACAEDDFKLADARLNKVYKRVLASLSSDAGDGSNPAETKRYLMAAQRSWVAFRENDCLAQDAASGNATLRIAYFGCMRQRAQARTKDLLEYIGN